MAAIGIITPPVVTTGLPEAPADGAWRIKTDGNGSFLQLKDAATDQWRSLFLNNGQLAVGPAES